MTVPFLVGHYASTPSDKPGADAYLRLLAETPWITGLEIPFPGGSGTSLDAVADRLPPRWTSALTMIPGTMRRLAADPAFGLASPDGSGRRAALGFLAEARDLITSVHERLGRAAIESVLVHSAPTAHGDARMLAESLSEARAWDWSGAHLRIEHCDSWVAGRRAEKGFLRLDEEIAVAADLGLRMHLNWGRSCLDARSADAVSEQILRTRAAGVLVGLIFSGASDRATNYCGRWGDGHLPSSPDEPASLLTPARIAACAEAAWGDDHAGTPARYIGAKVCVPGSAGPEERLAMIRRIYVAAMGQ